MKVEGLCFFFCFLDGGRMQSVSRRFLERMVGLPQRSMSSSVGQVLSPLQRAKSLFVARISGTLSTTLSVHPSLEGSGCQEPLLPLFFSSISSFLTLPSINSKPGGAKHPFPSVQYALDAVHHRHREMRKLCHQTH